MSKRERSGRAPTKKRKAKEAPTKPKDLPKMNMDNLRALGLLTPVRPPIEVFISSSSDSSSEEVWDLKRILEESPSTHIVREFIRANVECIEDPEEAEFRR